MKKIMIFAPYGGWLLHHQVDAIVGTALKMRGCDVNVIHCNSFFAVCPLKNTKKSCNKCNKGFNALFSKFSLSILNISSFINSNDINQCKKWSDNLKPEQFYNANFEENELGKWVYAGVCSYNISRKLDILDSKTSFIYKALLYNGALIKRFFDKYIQKFYPDYVICFHGKLSYYRIILELSRKLNINVMVHERGMIDDSFQFRINGHGGMSSGSVEAFENWRNIPLNKDQCKSVKDLLIRRENGKDISIEPFYTLDSNNVDIRRQLRIPTNSKIIAAFPASEWELGMFNNDINMPFKSSVEGIQQIIDSFDQKSTYLVFRHHPNLIGRNHTDYDFLYDLFKHNRYIPENVRVIMPKERLTSYDLIWHSQGAISFGSTIGFEALLRGIPVSSNVDTIYSLLNVGIDKITNVSDYSKTLHNIVEKSKNFGIEDLRTAYRGFHYFFIKLSYQFNSFGIHKFFNAHIKINSLDDLNPGKDPNLDKICDHIMFDKPLFPVPDEQDLQRSDKEETDFLNNEFNEIKKKRAEKTALHLNYKEPLLSFIGIRQHGVELKDDKILIQTKNKSRHKNIKYSEIAYPDYFDIDLFIQELQIAIEKTNSDFIYIGIENNHLDESFFSSSIDFLLQNEKYDAVLSGVWICDDKKIINEMFTERKDLKDYSFAKQNLPLITQPEYLLSLFLWRKIPLIKLLIDIKKDSNLLANFSQVLFNKTLSSNSCLNIYKSMVPNISTYVYNDKKESKKEITHKSSYLKYEEISKYVESIEGYLVKGQEEYLFNKAKSLPDNAVILEVGSCYGRSTAALAFSCIGSNKKIIAVDSFIGNLDGGTKKIGNTFFDIWYNNMVRFDLENTITPLVGFSNKALLKLERNLKIDFAFIDASHHYKDIIEEFELIYPFVKDGGWIAFHDVSPNWPGPWRIWRETGMNLLTSHEYCTTLACGKKQAGVNFVISPLNTVFSYSKDIIDCIYYNDPELSEAMKNTMLENNENDSMMIKSYKKIASMSSEVKHLLRGMITLEAALDPYLNFWNAITLLAERKILEASNILKNIIKEYPQTNLQKQIIKYFTEYLT